MNDHLYDFIGIGIGPFNLSLACLTAPIDELNGVFLDKRASFDWHPGLMFEDARLQTPFMSDLVTLADPTSPFSFLNYVKQQGRLYSFYIRENFFLLRNEYNQYCRWAASQLPNLHYNTEVESISYDDHQGCYVVRSQSTSSGEEKIYRARRLVIGTGPKPYTPPCSEALLNQNGDRPVIHASDYLFQKNILQQQRTITIIGSGQSAAEVVLDLLQDIDRYNYEISWITRSPRYFPLEYTKLTLEMTSPEYVDYFFQLPPKTREKLNRDHAQLAKGINSETINQIYDLLYAKRLVSDVKTNLLTNSELQDITWNRSTGSYCLHLHQLEQNKSYQHNADALVLATGYTYEIPSYLEGIRCRIRWNEQGQYEVSRYYTIDKNCSEIFVQNAEHHTHGFVTPDLGMACYRNSHIIRQLLGRDYYPIENRIAFQSFATPASESAKASPITV